MPPPGHLHRLKRAKAGVAAGNARAREGTAVVERQIGGVRHAESVGLAAYRPNPTCGGNASGRKAAAPRSAPRHQPRRVIFVPLVISEAPERPDERPGRKPGDYANGGQPFARRGRRNLSGVELAVTIV